MVSMDEIIAYLIIVQSYCESVVLVKRGMLLESSSFLLPSPSCSSGKMSQWPRGTLRVPLQGVTVIGVQIKLRVYSAARL